MTPASADAISLIFDQLDLVGQKYRALRIVRGLLLFGVWTITVTVVVAMLAHLAGEGAISTALLWGWIIWLIGSAIVWVVRPMLIRPAPVAVARMVEARVQGLHNGLTNAVLLSQADDLKNSPFLAPIFREILSCTSANPIDQAVRFTDLHRLLVRLSPLLIVALLLAILFPSGLVHGIRQMLTPGAFVPRQGDARIIDLQPGDVTVVRGAPLEIRVLVQADQPQAGRLFVQSLNPGLQRVIDLHRLAGDQELSYGTRLDHVDEPLRYRVEIGQTQSRWYEVNIVPRVSLERIGLRIVPPPYAARVHEAVQVSLDVEQVKQASPSMPLGSTVEITVTVDLPVAGAMLQVEGRQPEAMAGASPGRVFTGSIVMSQDAVVSILLTDTSGQIIGRVPESPLILRAFPDAPPKIRMHWPTQDTPLPPQAELPLRATLEDDVALTHLRVLMTQGNNDQFTTVYQQTLDHQPRTFELASSLNIPSELRKHGHNIRLRVEATDNRELRWLIDGAGVQTAQSPVYEIRFRDPEQIAAEQQQRIDALRQRLAELLEKQQHLHAQTQAIDQADLTPLRLIQAGQSELRQSMRETAQTMQFAPREQIVQKTLLVLVANAARLAEELPRLILEEPVPEYRAPVMRDLLTQQRQIISTLQSLLAMLDAATEITQQPSSPGQDLENRAQELADLKERLERFIAEQQRILDQTASLAKKHVDDFSGQDRKTLDELIMAQEKLDAFMAETVSDYSKLAEQDMANATLLKELMEVYSEVTMAKDALKQQALELAVSLEESGVELAGEILSNIEKWLPHEPDRIKWTMEDPLEKFDTPMAELPGELEDMIGQLMEQQEDLFDAIEDTNANWADSLDKGAGWDAMDGPIANMSAKGVTGNQLPNQNEMGGRSGEGRTGRSQGEMVEETATGKGGRNTPTRLDPTAFQQGQIDDQSTDPVGGATGGGKLSGQGGQGLEGPVPTPIQEQLRRLAERQAQLRNTAERLQMQHQVGRYDNFKLLESIALMRRVESDLTSNRYANAMRRREMTLDALGTSQQLISGTIHVQRDTSPAISRRLKDDISDALSSPLPPAWEQPLREYYRQLAVE